MKRILFLLIMAAIFIVGCANEEVNQLEKTETTEKSEKEPKNDEQQENKEKEQEKTSQKENDPNNDVSLDPLTVHYIDAGQGDAALLQFTDENDTYTILYDSGDWQGNEVVTYL